MRFSFALIEVLIKKILQDVRLKALSLVTVCLTQNVEASEICTFVPGT